MGFPRLFLVTTIVGICPTAWTQSPTYGVGKTPSPEEIRAWDIAISPTGKELPTGHGTATEGAVLYVRKGCASCHGAEGKGDTAMGKAMKVKDLGSDEVQKQSDADLTAVVEKGKKPMPGYEGKLTKDQITEVVKYLRTLKK